MACCLPVNILLFDTKFRASPNQHVANMKDVNDQNVSFFSPQPFFIGAFFSMQQLFQVYWLYRLWKLDFKNPGERAELEQQVDYAPYFTLGNLCIAGPFIF